MGLAMTLDGRLRDEGAMKRSGVELSSRAEWVADFRKCDNFYCHLVTSTWQLPKSMFRISTP